MEGADGMGGLGEVPSHSVRERIAAHPLWAIAAIMFAEEFGIPSPVPSDILMLLAGIRARRSVHPFWAILLVQEAATLVAAVPSHRGIANQVQRILAVARAEAACRVRTGQATRDVAVVRHHARPAAPEHCAQGQQRHDTLHRRPG